MAEILSQSLKKGAQRSLALPRRMRPVKRKSPLSTRIPHLLGARMVPNRKRSSRRRRRNTGVFWWMSCATATSISVWSLFSDASTRCILPTTTVNTKPKPPSTHNQNQINITHNQSHCQHTQPRKMSNAQPKKMSTHTTKPSVNTQPNPVSSHTTKDKVNTHNQSQCQHTHTHTQLKTVSTHTTKDKDKPHKPNVNTHNQRQGQHIQTS